MRHCWLAATIGVLLGGAAGAGTTALLAQRASYYWATQNLSKQAAVFETAAKADASDGQETRARDELAASILIRRQIADMRAPDLSWPVNMPFSMALDVITSPNSPVLNAGAAYASRSTSFLLDCAYTEIQARAASRELQSTNWDAIVSKYPGSNASNCSMLGKEYWHAPK